MALHVTGGLASVVGVPDRHSVLFLTVRSHERGPAVYIDQWGFMLQHSQHVAGGEWTNGPATPYRLEPGSRVTWMRDYGEARAFLAEWHQPPVHHWDVRPWIRLGSGAQHFGRHEHFGIPTVRIWEQGFVGNDGRRPFWERMLRKRQPILRWSGSSWEEIGAEMEPGTNRT
jgi:hypothetical protein